MQMSMCTASDRASGDGTSAEEPVHGALLATLPGVASDVVDGVSVVQALLLPISAIGLILIGLIRIGHGCGPPI
jgi:hypothetical protein